MSTPDFIRTLKDLGIDYSDYLTNAEAFSARVYTASQELVAILDDDKTTLNAVEGFKARAMQDLEAKAIAEEFIERMSNEISEMSPEVIAHILVRLPSIAKDCSSIVTAAGMRKTSRFSKGRAHAMYVELRRGYNKYNEMMKAFQGVNLPTLPARSGNYGDASSHGMIEYTFVIDGEEWKNWYTVAKLLGLPIEHYMDMVDHFNSYKEWNGHKLSMKIMER